MPALIVLQGAPRSGKTTRALEMMRANPNLVRTNRDDLRLAHYNTLGVLDAERESVITKLQHVFIETSLREGRDVICDDTNLVKRYVKRLYQIAVNNGAIFQYDRSFFSVSLETLLERNAASSEDRRLPEDVLRRFYARTRSAFEMDFVRLEDVQTIEPVTYNEALDDCILVDIDGTLANHHNVRDPYDTSLYHRDTLHVDVLDTVRALYHQRVCRASSDTQPLKIILVSGRHADFREVTESWLRAHDVAYDALYMRDEKDLRDDWMKLKLFNRHIRDQYNVIAVFDDRDRVVAMWRGLGLRVYQVNDGDF